MEVHVIIFGRRCTPSEPSAMSSQKQSHLYLEADAEKGPSGVRNPILADKEIYHEDGAILVDLGATHGKELAVALKTAKDGHVGHHLSIPSCCYCISVIAYFWWIDCLGPPTL